MTTTAMIRYYMILKTTVLSTTVVATTVSSLMMLSYQLHLLLMSVTMTSDPRRRPSDDGDDCGKAKMSTTMMTWSA
jgi:hypothetical protein